MKRAPWLFALLGLALRVAIALRPIETLDRLFIPDDTYYTLGFARALARGMGPTLDGVVHSNGFQPLLAFLLVPVFRICSGGDAPIRALLLCCALCDAATVVLLGRIAERVAGRLAGCIAAALWAFSPLALANALGGLETSLALALQLTLALAYSRLREGGPGTRRQWCLLGACAGLCVLARVDSVFLVAALVVFELRTLRQRAGTWNRLLAALCGVLVLLPWWGYSALRLHAVIPESGAGVLQITRFHRELYLTWSEQLGWAAGSLLGAPFADFPALRELLFVHPLLALLAFAIVLSVLVAAAVRSSRSGAGEASSAALGWHALSVLLFYALVVPALWFFKRYLVTCQALLTVVVAAVLSRPSPRRWALWLAAIAVASVGLRETAELALVTPNGTVDRGLHGAKGYRLPAKSVLAALPSHAVLGAFQSGALSYFAPPTVQVVNLDGVVDRAAREAGAARTLADYARARNLTHLADWRFNLDEFARLSAHAHTRPRLTETQTSAEPQGSDRFLLYALRWP